MHRTMIVSFPRSGHHLLVNLIKGVLGEEVRYCDPYAHGTSRLAKATLFKSHDFDLNEEAQEHTIVMIRKPEQAISAWYEIATQKERGKDWKSFHAEKLRFHKKFCRRWLGLGFPVVTYENLIAVPERILTRVTRYVSTAPVNADLIRKSIAEHFNRPSGRKGHFNKGLGYREGSLEPDIEYLI